MIARMYDKCAGKWYDTDPHQHIAYQHIADNPRAALFLGMSLSKTVVVLSYLYEMHYREAAFTKTLVIAPAKVARITWKDEIETWAHLEGLRYSLVVGTAAQRAAALRADAEIYIVGADNVVWLIEHFGGKLPFDSLVFDELDYFKGRGSKRFKSVRKAIKNVQFRIGMTGTPSPNGLTDLWAEMMLIDDGERLGKTWGAFVDKFFTTRGNGVIVYEYIPRPETPKLIAHKLRDICLTMQTGDHIELPPLHVHDEIIEFTPDERATYDRLEREFCLDFFDNAEVTAKTSADLSMKLLQISSGAIYEDGQSRKWHNVSTAKINALRDLLAEHDENVLLVYQFRHEVERVLAAFPHAREFKTEQDFRDWNAGKIRLLLVHPKSAGHGLNLQFGGRRMVWFTPTWNLGQYLQTVARLLRRGQEKAVHVHRLIVKGTRDEKVKRRIGCKDSNQKFLMNEIKALRAKYGK